MKKALLFGTTALVASSMFAADAIAQEEGAIVVGVSGFHRQYVSFQDNDHQGYNVVDQWSDSEIIFSGETQVMGGLEVGFNVQLESDAQNGDIDESFLYVEGAFGRLLIGSENGAAYLMQYGAPNVGPAINSGLQSQSIIGTVEGQIGPAYGTLIESGNDSDGQKITYFTPRFNGFQLGLSVLPDITGQGGGNTIDGGPGTPGVPGNIYDWGLNVGANYVQDFEDFNVAVAFGFSYADAKLERDDDYTAYSGGLNIGYGGFTVGGSVAVSTGELADNVPSRGGAVLDDTGIAWDAGVSYAQDRWSVSLTYFDNSMDDQVVVLGGKTSSNDNWAVQGSAAYRLGTGVDVVGYIGYAETEIATTGPNVQVGAVEVESDNGGVYGGVGVRTSF